MFPKVPGCNIVLVDNKLKWMSSPQVYLFDQRFIRRYGFPVYEEIIGSKQPQPVSGPKEWTFDQLAK